MSNYKQCLNGHYFAFGIVCPFCGAEESPESLEETIDFNQTMIECRKCGNWTPVRQSRCMYCGSNLFESAPQSEERKRLEHTPEHITQLPSCEALEKEIVSVNVNVNGHIYKLKGDYTASLVCYSEDAYRLYKRYRNWVVEAFAGDIFSGYEKHFDGEELSFSIPSSIFYEDREYRVTRIENGAFAFCVLLSIEIPDSIISIGNSAFFRCIGLRTIIIPDSVEHIEIGAVYKCPNLIYLKWKGNTHYSTVDNPIVFPPIR